MSASREKKQRQNDPNQGITPKQRQEQQAKQTAKKKAVLYTVTGVVIAVLVVVLLVWNSGIFQRRAAALSVGGRDYNVTDVSYYYYAALNNEYSGNSGAFDPQSDLRTQYVDADKTQSYHDKFISAASDSLVTVAALENAAAADGYTLTDEDRASVEENIASAKSTAQQYGYDYASFLKANYGRYMTPAAYKTCIERVAFINGYYNSRLEAVDVSEEALQTYYQENAATLDSYDYRSIYIDGSAPSGTDADGNAVDPTEEETDAAMQAAKEKADQFIAAVKASADREAAFIQFAPDYVSESGRENYENDPDYSLATGITGSDLTSVYALYYYGIPYGSWLAEEGRTAGDITAVEGGSGYYVVLFLDRYLDESNTADIRHILVKADLTQEDDPATEDVNESSIPTQEALDAAKAEVEALLDQWKSGEATAESFGTLAEANSDDAGSAANGGLYEGVYQGQMFSAFNDWILDSARQPGDTTLIENPQSGQQGWHAVYFQGWNDPLWKSTSVSAIQSEEMNTWLDDLSEDLEAVQGSGIKNVG